jgi:hypothetical protein
MNSVNVEDNGKLPQHSLIQEDTGSPVAQSLKSSGWNLIYFGMKKIGLMSDMAIPVFRKLEN